MTYYVSEGLQPKSSRSDKSTPGRDIKKIEFENNYLYTDNIMNSKEQLIKELDNVPETLIQEVLDFLFFLKAKQDRDIQDLQDARTALATVETEGTVAWEDLKAEIGL